MTVWTLAARSMGCVFRESLQLTILIWMFVANFLCPPWCSREKSNPRYKSNSVDWCVDTWNGLFSQRPDNRYERCFQPLTQVACHFTHRHESRLTAHCESLSTVSVPVSPTNHPIDRPLIFVFLGCLFIPLDSFFLWPRFLCGLHIINACDKPSCRNRRQTWHGIDSLTSRNHSNEVSTERFTNEYPSISRWRFQHDA